MAVAEYWIDRFGHSNTVCLTHRKLMPDKRHAISGNAVHLTSWFQSSHCDNDGSFWRTPAISPCWLSISDPPATRASACGCNPFRQNYFSFRQKGRALTINKLLFLSKITSKPRTNQPVHPCKLLNRSKILEPSSFAIATHTHASTHTHSSIVSKWKWMTRSSFVRNRKK